MDYQEEQTNEVIALQSIFGEDFLSGLILNGTNLTYFV
jgi:hypothetical protein